MLLSVMELDSALAVDAKFQVIMSPTMHPRRETTVDSSSRTHSEKFHLCR
jgi:hypothetical protein